MTQGDALTILKTGANVFLTGSPGSGKTHTINEFVAWLRESGIEPSITAATGIAATHVSGMTLHSWSGIGISDSLSPAEVDRIASHEHIARRIGKAKVLIIDEISMLSSATLEAADAVCREVRRSSLAFGGLQVIFVGDFFQLPPISKSGRETKFCYQSNVWKELNPIICYLEEQHRQADEAFLAVLAAIRSSTVEEHHHEQLRARHMAESAAPAGTPLLFSHNADVDRINATELAKLPDKPTRLLMSSTGKDSLVEGLKRGCLSPEVLELKKGAAVMFTKNSQMGRFVNGTLGVVHDFEHGSNLPIVELKNGELVTAEPMEWRVEEEGKVRASVTQVPLRLAYAMTVHKSQGQSLDAAVMDLSRAFEYGQGYVALSRVRSLAGVYLLGLNARALEVHPNVAEKDIEFRSLSRVAEHTFADMPKDELRDMQKRFVKALGGAWLEPRLKRGSPGAPKGALRVAMPGRLAETLQTVRESNSLKEAAAKRGLAASTIVKHLEELAEIGKLEHKDFARLLPQGDALRDIHDAFEALETDKLTPIFNALHGRYSFEIIRLVRLAKAKAL